MGNGVQNFLNLPSILRKKQNESEDKLLEGEDSSSAMSLVNDEVYSNFASKKILKIDPNYTSWIFINHHNLEFEVLSRRIDNNFMNAAKINGLNGYSRANIVCDNYQIGLKTKHIITLKDLNSPERLFALYSNEERRYFVFVLYNIETDIAESIIKFDYGSYTSFEELKKRNVIIDAVMLDILRKYSVIYVIYDNSYSDDYAYSSQSFFNRVLREIYQSLGFSLNIEI